MKHQKPSRAFLKKKHKSLKEIVPNLSDRLGSSEKKDDNSLLLDKFILEEKAKYSIGSGDDRFYEQQVEDYVNNQRMLWLDFIKFIRKELDSEFISVKEVEAMIERLIGHRENKRTDNTIFRQESDELNDEFITNLEELKSKLKEKRT